MIKAILTPRPLLLILLLLLPLAATAGIPEGHVKGLDSEISEALTNNLQHEGYLAHFQNGQDLQRGMSAYLWDNRQSLKHVDFHNARQVDVLICLMIKKGYDGFNDYAENKTFISWCEGMMK